MRRAALAAALVVAAGSASAQGISQESLTLCGRTVRFEHDDVGGIMLAGLDTPRIALGTGRVEVERADAPGAVALVIRSVRDDRSPGHGVVLHCGNGAPLRVLWQGSIAWRGEDVGMRVRDDVLALSHRGVRTVLRGHRREDLRLCGASAGFVDAEALDVVSARWSPTVVDPRAIVRAASPPQRVTATAGAGPGLLEVREVSAVLHPPPAGETRRGDGLSGATPMVSGDWVHLGLLRGGVTLRALQLRVPRGATLPRRWLLVSEPDGGRFDVDVPASLARAPQDRDGWVEVPLPRGAQPQCFALIPREPGADQRLGGVALRSDLDEGPDAAIASLLRRADRPDGDDAAAVLATLGARGRDALANALPSMSVPGARRTLRILAGAREPAVVAALARALTRAELREAAASSLQRAGAEALAPLAEVARAEPSAARALATLRVPVMDRLRALSRALDADGDAWRAVRAELGALVAAAAQDGGLDAWLAELPADANASSRALRVAAEALEPGTPAMAAVAAAARARWAATEEFAPRYRLLFALPGDDAGRALAESVLAEDADIDLRAVAARSLGRFGRSWEPLRRAFEDRAPRVRAAVARALASEAGATEVLVERLRSDPWPSVRVAAAESLGARADAARALLAALDDASFVVVGGALGALARTPGAEVSASLQAFADDGRRNPALRREAVEALGERCDRGALAGLERLAETESDPALPRYEQEIGQAALAAVARLDADRARSFLTRNGSNASAAAAVERAAARRCGAPVTRGERRR
ncbi:MAG: HEAT repeat domain-containing protein [Polyangiales bacterium]